MHDERQEVIDITPTTDIIAGMRATPLGWRKAIAELIDNSFDAQAATVRIDIQRNLFAIADDGVGCNDIRAMFRMGDHKEQAGKGLGRYGVGLKDASVWLGGTTEIKTTRDKKYLRGILDWNAMEKSGKWELNSCSANDITEDDARLAHAPYPRGTSIIIKHTKPTPTDAVLQKLVADLGFTFCPAITSGRGIVVTYKKKQIPIPAFKIPVLEKIIDREGEIYGKRFRVRAGVVPQGHPNERPGFSIAYRHRVITTTADGCGQYGCDRFFGWVDLSDDWQLSRNKDEIAEYGDALANTLESLCKEQLSNASLQARSIELSGLEGEIEGMINAALGALSGRKAKRTPTKEQVGTVEPRETGRTHKQAAKTQSGERKLTTKVGDHVRVVIIDEDIDDGMVGRIVANASTIHVTLSRRHPAVEWATAQGDNRALSVIVAALLSMFAVTEVGSPVKPRLLSFMDADTDKRAALYKALSVYTQGIKPDIAIAQTA